MVEYGQYAPVRRSLPQATLWFARISLRAQIPENGTLDPLRKIMLRKHPLGRGIDQCARDQNRSQKVALVAISELIGKKLLRTLRSFFGKAHRFGVERQCALDPFKRKREVRPCELVFDPDPDKRREWMRGPFRNGVQPIEQQFPFPTDQGNEDRLFVGEILIERSDADTCPFSDAVGVESRRRKLFQNASRRLDDGVTGGNRTALTRRFTGLRRGFKGARQGALQCEYENMSFYSNIAEIALGTTEKECRCQALRTPTR